MGDAAMMIDVCRFLVLLVLKFCEYQNSTTNIAYSQHTYNIRVSYFYIPIIGCNNLSYVRLYVVGVSLVCYLKNTLKTWLTCRCNYSIYLIMSRLRFKYTKWLTVLSAPSILTVLALLSAHLY